jgi:hypothetical protein
VLHVPNAGVLASAISSGYVPPKKPEDTDTDTGTDAIPQAGAQ